MDARELTKAYNDLRNEHFETSKKVEYLENEVNKLRLLVEDLKIDVAMLNRERGAR